MTDTPETSSHPTNGSSWPGALVHALPVMALVLGLFYYWFAIADRHIVFLYYHDMGPRIPDTSPFSVATSGRYWMAGLVAGGAVLVLHTAASWLLGRLKRVYRPPAWWRIWMICAAPLAGGILLITMTVNQPTLPASNAAQATLAALIGLALALIPGRMAAERPCDLAWLASDGLGMMMVLLHLSTIEHVVWGLTHGTKWILAASAAILAAGLGWLLAMTGLYLWRCKTPPGATRLFLAGAIAAYLLMPLVHHTMGTDGYFYISTADNFFASNIALQIAAWLIGAAMAVGITRLRRHLQGRWMPG